MIAIVLYAALCGQPPDGPAAVDSIPALAVDRAAVDVARTALAQQPAPPAPMPSDTAAFSSTTDAGGPNARILGLMSDIDQRLDRLERDLKVALNQPAAAAVTLPVQPADPPPAPAAPAKPSPQAPLAVTASPQTAAVVAPVVATSTTTAAATGLVYPGPILRTVGLVGEGLANFGRPRVYLARQPRQPRPRVVRQLVPIAPAPAQQVTVTTTTTQPVVQAPVIQPAPLAPAKGGM